MKEAGVEWGPGNAGNRKLKCIPLLGMREGIGEQIVLLQKHWICPSFDLRWTEQILEPVQAMSSDPLDNISNQSKPNTWFHMDVDPLECWNEDVQPQEYAGTTQCHP